MRSLGPRETRLSDRPPLTLPERRRRPTCQSAGDKRADARIDNSKGSQRPRSSPALLGLLALRERRASPVNHTHGRTEQRREERRGVFDRSSAVSRSRAASPTVSAHQRMEKVRLNEGRRLWRLCVCWVSALIAATWCAL